MIYRKISIYRRNIERPQQAHMKEKVDEKGDIIDISTIFCQFFLKKSVVLGCAVDCFFTIGLMPHRFEKVGKE